jgi:hypothetical protein
LDEEKAEEEEAAAAVEGVVVVGARVLNFHLLARVSNLHCSTL